ncbi:hypothetical protein [Lactobacillus delbrueckii]|uniref:hypothetical protein n=1 Tax=Lactobacillus delbrueckii TaxID=1584 RepID=UPI001F07D4DA|nr:hypothetical protein [Lactobacillus delbrueckii]
MLNKTLLKRNLQLYWHNIKFRFLIVYPAMLLLLAFKSCQGMGDPALFRRFAGPRSNRLSF